MPRPPRFTIRAASALTGINQNTLRAWERRHGLVVPQRTPKGYRLYSDADIQRLRRIQQALQEGFSVGRMRERLQEMEEAGSTPEGVGAGTTPLPPETRRVEISLAAAGLSGTTQIRLPSRGGRARSNQSLAEFSENLEQAASRFDRPALERIFTRTVGLYSLRQAFYHALAPALARTGERFLANQGSVAEEHFLSTFMREKLFGALAGLRPLHQQPRALFACVPRERHEIPLMLLALETGLEGVSTLFLGADTPVEAVLRASEASRVRVVALSATLALPQEALLALSRRLAELPRRPLLMLGGPAVQENLEWIGAIGARALPLDVPEAGRRVMEAMGRGQA